MLNKKNGLLVLDDELVSSHATDVKLKTVSDHKSGKEGPGSDCISNSQLRTLFAMQLRTKGVSCEENCLTNIIPSCIIIIVVVGNVLVALVVAGIQSLLLSHCIVVLFFACCCSCSCSSYCCQWCAVVVFFFVVVRRSLSSARHHPPLLVAITVYCCFALFHIVSRCCSCSCPCGCCVHVLSRSSLCFVSLNLITYIICRLRILFFIPTLLVIHPDYCNPCSTYHWNAHVISFPMMYDLSM